MRHKHICATRACKKKVIHVFIRVGGLPPCQHEWVGGFPPWNTNVGGIPPLPYFVLVVLCWLSPCCWRHPAFTLCRSLCPVFVVAVLIYDLKHAVYRFVSKHTARTWRIRVSTWSSLVSSCQQSTMMRVCWKTASPQSCQAGGRQHIERRAAANTLKGGRPPTQNWKKNKKNRKPQKQDI